MIRQFTESNLDSSQSANLSTQRRFAVVKLADAPTDLIPAWAKMQDSNTILASPYFHPEFTKAVGRVRKDVHVAFVTRGNVIESIIPFQKNGNEIVPVGGRINDVHGVISDGNRFSDIAQQAIRTTRSSGFGFHSAVNTDQETERFQFERKQSYYLDLSKGWSEYRKWVRKHSSTVARQGQKTRGLIRDHGDLRFEFDVQDSQILEELIEMKRQKYQRTRTFDILSVDWAADLLRELLQVRVPGFQGLLSTLHAGDKLVAVHFGMLTNSILHYWFPVYDPTFSRYSPGTELMLRCAEAATERGVKKLDLGYGDDPYKLKFSNGIEPVVCGKFTTGRLAFLMARKRYKIRNQLKKIPMKPLAKTMLRTVFPGFGGWNYK